jgi:alpha-amylase/alpha-mannosidase (GH57 family)
LHCFFRDDNLSDLIGFTYADWNANDAVDNFIHHPENIVEACKEDDNRVISVILDGENCWEYYSHNGYHFLNTLYSEIAKHPKLELTTFSNTITNKTQAKELKTLVAGSWVHGTFSTWIGEPAKNQAWELLIEAKHCYDKIINSGTLPEHIKERANIQLAICEGSDWSWWFGDYNAEESVSLFDALYRTHLKTLYQILGESPPAHLSERIAYGSGDPANSGTMRRAHED